ncbi:hypothetical protein [Rhodanobacter denitrificans]|uniref:Uncharacterized protein n=1 Tax=Rhodanobacter denitrificans TaxID=666685 RepID=M4NQL8_9GAMM|nr:hypothetical protein [Rhodanobacter denitrificans]AGG89891.1 hypothetical protein R2APBS1_2813 [Rhodanobacter denitrificans]UJM85287.1 hypothetical protein LRJ86_10905 [Rhodanobacter denitrificans]
MHADTNHSNLLTPDAVLAVLQASVGEASGVTAEQLVLALTGRRSEADQRRLRTVVEALRTAGHRICANPTHGYYLAANDKELDRSCSFLFDRAMTSLRQISAMKRVSLPDLRGQLGLPIGANHESHE